jgi:hypothetical protein
MRVIVGLISTNMLEDGKVVGKLFHPSRTATDGSLQTPRKRQMHSTLIIPQFSAARTFFLIYRVELQENHLPLIVKSSGEELKR